MVRELQQGSSIRWFGGMVRCARDVAAALRPVVVVAATAFCTTAAGLSAPVHLVLPARMVANATAATPAADDRQLADAYTALEQMATALRMIDLPIAGAGLPRLRAGIDASELAVDVLAAAAALRDIAQVRMLANPSPGLRDGRRDVMADVLVHHATLIGMVDRLEQAENAGDAASRFRVLVELARLLDVSPREKATSLDPSSLSRQFIDPASVRDPLMEDSDFSVALVGRHQDAKGAKAAQEPPGADDLGETDEVRITPDIQAKADELGNDPVAIRNWVYNEIDYAPGFGSTRNAQRTLWERRGNAFDIHSLLIALLRASGIPARYVYGTVDLPIEAVRNWLGDAVADADMAADLLVASGVPTTVVTSGGVVRYLRIEHVWAEAWVDFSPSRGARNRTGDTWVPLEASFKTYATTPSVPFLQHVDFNAQAAQAEMLAGAQQGDGWITGIDTVAVKGLYDRLTQQALDYVQAHPATDPALTLGGRHIVPVSTPVLEGSLPYRVASAQSYRLSALPPSLQQRIRLAMYATAQDAALDSPQFTAELPMAKLGMSSLQVGYPGASEADRNLIAGYAASNAETLPASALRVVPTLTLSGTVLAQGSAVQYGTQQYWRTSLLDAAGSTLEPAEPSAFPAGTSIAFVADPAGGTTPEFAQALTSGYGDSANLPIDQALSFAGMQYWALTDHFDAQVAQARNVAIARVPSVGAFATALRISYFFGVPRTAAVRGFTTDIKAVRYAAIASTPEARIRALTQAGAMGSLSEGLTWSLLTGQDVSGSMSASSLLLRANEARIPIHLLDRSNIAQYLPQLALNADDKADISNAVNAGMVVLTPARELTINGWTGVGYLVQDPSSGAGLWRVSGGINGAIDVGCIAKAIVLNLLCQMRFMKGLKRLLGLTRPGYLVGALALEAALALIPVVGPIVAAVAAALVIVIVTIEVIMWLHEVINDISALTPEDLAALGMSDINELICSLGSPCFASNVFETFVDDARYGWSLEGFANDFIGGATFGLAGGESGPGAPAVGNPVSVGNGIKWQWEADYVGAGPYPLAFVRTYSSAVVNGSVMGNKWTHTYQRAIRVAPAPLDGNDIPEGPPPAILVMHGDGTYFQFVRRGDAYVGEGNLPESAVRLTNATGDTVGWEVVNLRDETEHYDARGRLQWVRSRAGLRHVMGYNGSGQLVSVSDDFGYSLAFAYDPETGLLDSMTDPAGEVTHYAYDPENGNATAVSYPDGRSRRYHYEDLRLGSHLTGLTDERGVRVATWAYDYRGRAVLSTHAGDADRYVLRYGEDETTVTDPLGTERTYRYTRLHERPYLVSVTQACGSCSGGSTAELRYDSRGFVASSKDFNGNLTVYAHNVRGLQESRTEASGTALARTITTQWHPRFRRPARISEPVTGGSRVTDFTYDTAGNLAKIAITAASETRTWTFGVNSHGQVLSVDGPRSDIADVTAATYDEASGALLTSTNALGHVTHFTGHDAHGRVTATRGPNGLATTYAYDLRGRLTAIVEKASDAESGETMGFDYDATGNLTRLTLADGSWLGYTYDDAGRLIDVTDNLGNAVHYTLDAQGNRTREDTNDPNGVLASTLARVPDALGRLKESHGARADEVYAFTYDGNGNEKTAVDPLGHVSSSSWDALDRLTRTDVLDPADPGHAAISYGYDVAGNLATVTDPRNLDTRYDYTGFGEVSRQTSPDTGIGSYAYDAAGNLRQSTDARGQRALFDYDAGNRLTGIRYGAAQGDSAVAGVEEALVFGYDDGANALGRLSSADVAPATGSPGASQLDYVYDAHGRVTRGVQQLGNATSLATSYHYDAAGRLDERTLPSGAVIGYSYGADGRVLTITVNGIVIVRDVGYFPFGEVQRWREGDLTDYTREFDQDGRIREHRAGSATRQLAYDAASRVTAQADQGVGGTANWSFGYDGQDRLSTASNAASAGPIANLAQSWSYDATGNRRSATENGVETIYDVDGASNHLLGVGSLSRSYDAAGNTISSGSRSYAYSARNRLVEALQANAPVATYAYNAWGERVCKATAGRCPTSNDAGSGYTQFVYDDSGHLVGEYDSAGNLIQETLWLDDTPVAVLRATTGPTAIPASLGGQQAGNVAAFWIEPDHLDTPRIIVNATHNVVWRWDSDPFGNTPANENPLGLGPFAYNLRFPGQYFDQETGLHYNYFRDYEPGAGSYVESDAIGIGGGLATYSYVASDPLTYYDDLGDRRSRRGRRIAIDKILNDPKQPRCVRGFLANEIRHASLGGRPSIGRDGVRKPQGNKYIRLPPGFELAHPYGMESCLGHGYRSCRLNNTSVHRNQTAIQLRRGIFK